jgi:IclR helix-turn-helix domain
MGSSLEKHLMTTIVCICEHARVADDESISIVLSPAQVDEIVRAATHSRAPSVSTLIGGYMPTDREDTRLSRSLVRGLSVLTCFGPDGEARGIVDIAGDLDMSPSTAHRYAYTLVELGLLERCPRTRKYRLPGT